MSFNAKKKDVGSHINATGAIFFNIDARNTMVAVEDYK
jgi:hypothetical protein